VIHSVSDDLSGELVALGEAIFRKDFLKKKLASLNKIYLKLRAMAPRIGQIKI